MIGKRGIGPDTFDRLAEVLKFELAPVRTTKSKGEPTPTIVTRGLA